MGFGAKTKGYLKDVKRNSTKRFMFNPETFNDKQQINFSVIESPCSNYPKFQYVGTKEKTISLELYLHGKAKDVKSWIDWLNKLLPTKKFDVPHEVIFAFGSYASTCVVTSIDRKFQDFDKNLNITRATISLSLTEVR